MDNLPQLAVGSHKRGSGQACIMNAISYLNGDTEITDMPSCTHPVLAKAAQAVNDRLCKHRNGNLLCSDCSHVMWMLGARLIGTASAVDGWSSHDRHVLNVRLACWSAEQVIDRAPEKARAAIEVARRWTRGEATVEECRKAAVDTADAAAYSAYAATATYAAYSAYAATATAYAAYAAYAAVDAAVDGVDAAAFLSGLIDEFERLTGFTGRAAFAAEEAAEVVAVLAQPR